MVSVLASSAVGRRVEPRLGQTKYYKIGICCFSAMHAALRRKSKDWLARYQDNVSEWDDMSISGLLFHRYKTQLSMLVWYKADLIIISLNITIGLAMILLRNCRVDVKQQSLKIEKYLLIFITNKYVYIKYYGKCEVIPRVNQ